MPIKDKQIFDKFLELKEIFPFGEAYVEGRFSKYLGIARVLVEACPDAARILSIGSGPCDLEAILSKLGFHVTAVDDLNDQWHLIGRNRDRIRDFAKEMNIEFLQESADSLRLKKDTFDVVLLIDVIEHLHTSPRELLNSSISFLRPNGLLVIETPNSVALAKRLRVLFGKTGHGDVNFMYWNVGQYRGHVREYTPSELRTIVSYHNLREIELKMINVQESALLKTANSLENAFKGIINSIYGVATAFSPNFKDTVRLVARKPHDWQPTTLSMNQFKRYCMHVDKFNLDGESDEIIISKMTSPSNNRLQSDDNCTG